MTTEQTEKLEAELRTVVEDFDQEKHDCNMSSDNYGDVYEAGSAEGEVYLARKILREYFGD